MSSSPWRGGVPSLTMPVSGRVVEDAVVAPFIANLLPDNDNTKELQTSTNPFAILRHKGQDCPGACQFVPEDRVLSGSADGFDETPHSTQ